MASATGSSPERLPAAYGLQSRLRWQLLTLLAGLWLLASTAVGLTLWHETDEVLDSSLQETAERLLMMPEAALQEGVPTERWALLDRNREFVVYQVFDAEGRLRLQSHAAPARPLDPGAPDGLRESGAWHVATLTAPDRGWRAQVAETVAHRREVLWDSIAWLVGMLLALLPLAALGLRWLLRRGFATLEPARTDLARRARHDLQPLDTTGVPAELRPWLDTVNVLLERVRALVESERAFASNTAHELRTPLAAAMARAQRMLRTSSDATTREQALALLHQLERLNTLATRLLDLARIESGVALQRAPVDLVQLAELVADDFADARRQDRLRVEVHGDPVPVSGDVDALGIALRNLIANALTHGGDAARVCVHVGDRSLRVEDDGPGVPSGALVGLVRKFARGPYAQGRQGSGLGLAMVDAIARQSGARLELQSPAPCGRGFSAGLTFDLDLAQEPMAPRPLAAP